MPSRNMRCPAPSSGRRPSMAGSGHPPLHPRRVRPVSRSGEGKAATSRSPSARNDQVCPSRDALDLRPEAETGRSPSRVQGVCGEPAMDGRRPALGAGRGDAGVAHPLCAGRAAQTHPKQSPLYAGRAGRTPPEAIAPCGGQAARLPTKQSLRAWDGQRVPARSNRPCARDRQRGSQRSRPRRSKA